MFFILGTTGMMSTTLLPDFRWPPAWIISAGVGTRLRRRVVLRLLLVVFPTLGLLLVFVTHGVSPIVANGSWRSQSLAPFYFKCVLWKGDMLILERATFGNHWRDLVLVAVLRCNNCYVLSFCRQALKEKHVFACRICDRFYVNRNCLRRI